MPKVKFTSDGANVGWHDPVRDWKDGEVREVSAERASELTATFPTLFSIVTEPSAQKAAEAPPSNRMAKEPGKNK